jgi:hypothetical protein
LTDPKSEPARTVVMSGPATATEADATRAFVRWFQLLRAGQPIEGDGAGLGDGWAVRPLLDGADRPHDPFAWDSRDVALATLTACRTIEDLEALGSLFPLARTLFGDRATRPLARALAESVFESLARGHTTFSAIRLATAAAPLFSSEQLAQVVSWDDSGELVVPAGQIRALADDLHVLFGDIRSPRRRLTLVEGAWSHAVELAALASSIRTCRGRLDRRRKVSVTACDGYLERLSDGGSSELREMVANLLLREVIEARRGIRPDSVWRLTDLGHGGAKESVDMASGQFRAGGISLMEDERVEAVKLEERRVLADTAAQFVHRHPWCQSDAITRAIGEDWRRELERDEQRQWSQVARRAAQEANPVLAMPWMLDRWPVDLVGLIALVANHHRLTRSTVGDASSRARTWPSFARDVSAFELGDLAVPDESWIGELDGATIDDLTVSVARSSQTLLQWADYMGNCIYSMYRSEAVAGGFVFVALSEPDGTMRYNASISPHWDGIWEIAARFNAPAPQEVESALERLIVSLKCQQRVANAPTDEEVADLLEAAPVKKRRGPRGGKRRTAAEARRVLAIVDADLQRDRSDWSAPGIARDLYLNLGH